MSTKKFPSELASRGTVLVTDKLLIHNITTGVTCYTTVAELFTSPVFTGNVTLEIVNTLSGTTASTASDTPVALFTVANPGVYLVTCYVSGGDTPTHAVATIIFDGGGGPQYSIRNYDHGAQMTITQSGGVVYATHSFGSSQPISYSVLRLK